MIRLISPIKNKINSHISQAILLLLGLIIFSSIINMGCEMCDIREFFFKSRMDMELQFTDDLTDPNIIQHKSQPTKIIDENPIITYGKSHWF